ncbi:hypothetical protein HU200_016321 [Digitaria exilis]|uniref:Epidermal patterning factor-like protein n=1 Tax=Digitaria exilis TaxID=1010633 RepID=A0A835F9M6_9POAL|nr:hypothetical protein HU200_016321 [Digitaria exilis]
MEVAYSDAGRMPPLRLPEIGAIKQQEQEASILIRDEMVMKQGRRALIGSRPPRCERLCISCGHCEAVQVPIVPQQDDHHRLIRSKRSTTAMSAAMFTYRVDGIANYKPLSWKCRCGGTILDP